MVKLFISTFGEKIDWIRLKQATPIEVGCECRPEATVHYELKDVGGDSISDLNPWFGELTGLYWIWKNHPFAENEIIGFAHYNKILDINPAKAEHILTQGDADWIVRIPIKLVKHAYEQDIEVLESVIRDKFPSYYNAWSELFCENGESRTESCANCEMFYTTVKEFESYCEFLFGVLFEVFNRIGKVDRVPFHKRYCAFLGERLLSVYILANRKSMLNVPTNGKANPVIRFLRWIYRRTGLNKNPLLGIIKKKLAKNRKRQSSYLK